MKKVLVIDDEEYFCRVLKKGFEMKGDFQVLTSTNGKDGLHLAKTQKPDVILLDVMMPDMDGTEVAEALLVDIDTRSIPLIFVTAIINEDDVKDNEGIAGGRIFIPKPVKIDALITKIDSVLAGHARVA